MILKVISQSSGDSLGDITPTAAITAGVDTTSDSIFWFTPYKASLFPEVTVDKDYFFLWSTDHDGGAGGVWWGKGDNLDLSDFVEVSATPIVTGSQAETAFLHRAPELGRPLRLFYHTQSGACAGQHTKLVSSTGGALHSATWVQEGDPFGCQGDIDGFTQNHTGYFRFWNINNELKGTHYFTGIPTNTVQISTSTNNSLSWVQENSVATALDDDEFLEVGRYYTKSWSTYFELYGTRWMFINSADDTNGFAGGTDPSGKTHLVKVDADLNVTELVATLNGDNEDMPFEIYIEGNTAHFYRQSGRTDRPNTFIGNVAYASLDLTPLSSL